MSIPAVSYEDFSTSNQGVVEDGGPWIVQSADISTNSENTTGCADESTSWCEGHCLTCHVEPLNPPPAYYGSFATNVSVNLTDYGGATSLDFSWNYWPAYCGGATNQGVGIPVTSQVGDATFEEEFPALSFAAFFLVTTGGHQWDIADKISHNGSTSLVRGSDPNLGYIALKINATMAYSAANHEEYLYFYVKAIGFLITTPILNATAASSSSTSSAPAGVSATAASSSSTSSAQAGISATAASSLPTSSALDGVIAGAVVEALAFAALFIFAVHLFRSRRNKGQNQVDNDTIFSQRTNYEAPPPLGAGAVPPSHWNTRYHSAQHTGFASPGSESSLPTLPPDELNGQGRSSLTPSSHIYPPNRTNGRMIIGSPNWS